MPRTHLSSEFLNYLAATGNAQGYTDQLPSLNVLSKQLGISVARLREQLEVAKALGLVEARPRTGLRRLPYSFLPAVMQSLSYAIQIDKKNFTIFAELRNQIEAAYWEQAACLLTLEDHQELKDLVARALDKLGEPDVQIPHEEHRQFHATIFRRLNNPFVQGILGAYWEAYEVVGLNIFTDYEYLLKVWEYHQKIVDSICDGDIEGSYQALIEYRNLIYHKAIQNTNTNNKPLPAGSVQ